MPDRLSLLNLEEWYEAPVRRFSPLPAAVVLAAAGGTLTLTSAGSVPVGNGNLPTAADLNRSPYYHLYISCFDAGGAGQTADPPVTVSIDGAERLAPVPITADEFSIPYPPGIIQFRIPATVQQIVITNNDAAINATLVYSYGIPQIPTNRNGERLSLTAQQEWGLAPYEFLNTEAVGNTFATPIVVAAGATQPLILPNATQLLGSPYYYLSASITAALNPADTEGAYILYNASTVPGDKIQIAILIGGASTILPDAAIFASDNALNITTFPFPKLSADGTTAISVVNTSAAIAYNLRYRFVLPVVAVNDFPN